MNKVGFVIALKAEAPSLQPLPKPLYLNALSGAGPKAAEMAALKLVDAGAKALISWGCAAALAPDLKPGDLILPRRILAEDGKPLETDRAWLESIKPALSNQIEIHEGDLIESSRIVARADDKKQLYQQSHAIALDMESAAIARIAQKHGLPFIAIRAIVDPAQMDLSDAILASMDEKGEVDIVKLILRAFLKPSEFKALILLGLHFNQAMSTLKKAAKLAHDAILFQPVQTHA